MQEQWGQHLDLFQAAPGARQGPCQLVVADVQMAELQETHRAQCMSSALVCQACSQMETLMKCTHMCYSRRAAVT